MQRILIVNADDFGQSEGVNQGILRAHREGILTSASLMVRRPAAEHAARHAGDLDLGLHVDLGEWAFSNGQWSTRYERAPLGDPSAVEEEFHHQLVAFRRLTGKSPTHIDSHQHVHLHEPVLTIARQVADDLVVPLRGHAPKIQYCGSFYGQSKMGFPCPEAIALDAMIELLVGLPPGTTELGCHPGEDADLDSTYCRERFQEVEVLCHPRVRLALDKEDIRLAAFADILAAPVPPEKQQTRHKE